MPSLGLSVGNSKARQPAGPTLPRTTRPDTPPPHAMVTTASLAGGTYPSLVPLARELSSRGSRSPRKTPHESGHVTPGASSSWGSPKERRPVPLAFGTFRFAVHGGLRQHIPLGLGSASHAARAAVALSCRLSVGPPARVEGPGGLPQGSSLLPRFPCPQADITAQRHSPSRDSRAGDGRTGGQQDACAPWREGAPKTPAALGAGRARLSPRPSLPTAPPGKLRHGCRGGNHTTGHCSANTSSAPLWAAACAGHRGVPHQPPTRGCSPRRPPSLQQPMGQGASTPLNAPPGPGMGGMLRAQPLAPIPAGSAAGRHKAAAEQATDTHAAVGSSPGSPAAHFCIAFIYIYIYKYIISTYIKPPWLCCGLPMAHIPPARPWALCSTQQPLRKGFPGSDAPRLYCPGLQSFGGAGFSQGLLTGPSKGAGGRSCMGTMGCSSHGRPSRLPRRPQQPVGPPGPPLPGSKQRDALNNQGTL